MVVLVGGAGAVGLMVAFCGAAGVLGADGAHAADQSASVIPKKRKKKRTKTLLKKTNV